MGRRSESTSERAFVERLGAYLRRAAMCGRMAIRSARQAVAACGPGSPDE
jgi:hypothetical protein